MKGVVYDPPGAGLPYLAVVFHGDELIVAKPVPSLEAGNALIESVFLAFVEAKANGKI